MRRRLVVALLLAGLVAGGCTQGFVLEDGERPEADLTQAKFAFAEGETEIQLGSAPTSLATPTPTSTPTPTAAPSPEAVSPSTTATPPPVTAGPGGTAEATVTGAVTAPAGGIDPEVIAANPLAASIAIPNAGVDPGLETFDEVRDPTVFFAPETLAEARVESFVAMFSGRQPESGALSELRRPVQLTQFVFVHETFEAAIDFFAFASAPAIDNLVANWVQAYQESYPNLEVSGGRLANLPEVGDDVGFAVLLMDPNVPPDSPVVGPPVPVVYFIAVRVGRTSAVLEIAYLDEQNPSDVLPIADVFVTRVPTELRSAAGP